MTLKELRQRTENGGEVKLSEILLPKQLAAFKYLNDKVTNELFYGGAAGGGKSLLIAIWLSHRCLKYPGSRWLMGRSELKTLKETTLATFFDLTSALGWGKLYNYNQQSGVIKWTNGSEILLKDLKYYPSDPNFDGLGSLEISGAVIDECPQVTHRAKEIVKSRIRYKLDEFGLIPKMLMTGNPAKNWVYTEFYNPAKKGQLPKERAFLPALVTDNPYLPTSYIDNLRNLKHEADKQRLLYGNFDYDDDPAALIDYEAQNDLFHNEHIQPDALNKYMTCDIAGRGSDCFRIGVWHGWVLVEDFEMPISSGKEVVDKIREIKVRCGVPNSNLIYDADGVGGGVDGFFPGAKAFLNGGSPLNGENYENLKTQCYYKLAELINARQMWVKAKKSPDQIELITQELGQVKRRAMDADGKLKIIRKEDVKDNIGRSPDYSEMMMTRCFFALKKATPAISLIRRQ